MDRRSSLAREYRIGTVEVGREVLPRMAGIRSLDQSEEEPYVSEIGEFMWKNYLRRRSTVRSTLVTGSTGQEGPYKGRRAAAATVYHQMDAYVYYGLRKTSTAPPRAHGRSVQGSWISEEERHQKASVAEKWNESHQLAMEDIKCHLLSATKLWHPKEGHRVCLFIDESDTRWAAILSQIQEAQKTISLDEEQYEPYLSPLEHLEAPLNGGALLKRKALPFSNS